MQHEGREQKVAVKQAKSSKSPSSLIPERLILTVLRRVFLKDKEVNDRALWGNGQLDFSPEGSNVEVHPGKEPHDQWIASDKATAPPISGSAYENLDGRNILAVMRKCFTDAGTAQDTAIMEQWGLCHKKKWDENYYAIYLGKQCKSKRNVNKHCAPRDGMWQDFEVRRQVWHDAAVVLAGMHKQGKKFGSIAFIFKR